MKKHTLLTKLAASVLAAAVLTLSFAGTAHAEELPYDTYNYDYRENFVLTPAAYVPNGSVTGQSVGTTDFTEPQDLCVADDGLIYVADTKNNRIVVLNDAMTETVRVIDGFDNNGQADTFNQPYGVCVSESGYLYVADSMNKRIVMLTPEGEFVKIIDNPQSEILEEGFDFIPIKVTVDYADRVFWYLKVTAALPDISVPLRLRLPFGKNSGEELQPRKNVPNSSCIFPPSLPVWTWMQTDLFMQPISTLTVCRR